MTFPKATFGAVCSRCNHDYPTRIWKAPYNTPCPNCMSGAFGAQPQVIARPRDWADVVDASWGAGS